MAPSSLSKSRKARGSVAPTNGHSGSRPVTTTDRLNALNLGERDARERRRDKMLMAKYGLSLAQFEKMLLIQRGKCGICDRFFHGVRRMYVDHDHQSGRVRGILCYPCNHRLLGRGLEDPFVHERAAAYLRSTFDGRNLGKGELN